MYETMEAKKYKENFAQYIKREVKKQNFRAIRDKKKHYYCDCIFYFDRIDRDANNYFKLLLDAITDSQCIWIDDNVVCERVNAIYYDASNPRIELEIYPVSYVGIFHSKKAANAFKARCTSCKKYLDGRCSILKKAFEGRIQSIINSNYSCDKYIKKN